MAKYFGCSQRPRPLNLGDIGTKPLAVARKRLLGLMGGTGMVYVESQEPVGESERLELQEQVNNSRSLSKLTKTIFRLSIMLGLEPTVAGGQEETCNVVEQLDLSEIFWISLCLFLVVLSWFVLLATSVRDTGQSQTPGASNVALSKGEVIHVLFHVLFPTSLCVVFVFSSAPAASPFSSVASSSHNSSHTNHLSHTQLIYNSSHTHLTQLI